MIVNQGCHRFWDSEENLALSNKYCQFSPFLKKFACGGHFSFTFVSNRLSLGLKFSKISALTGNTVLHKILQFFVGKHENYSRMASTSDLNLPKSQVRVPKKLRYKRPLAYHRQWYSGMLSLPTPALHKHAKNCSHIYFE